MKITKTVAMAALLCSSMITSPALAAVTVLGTSVAAGPDATTLAAMQQQCDALAAAHDTNNGDIWSAEVVEGAATRTAGPTETGSHTYAADGVGDQTGAGTFTPAHREIEGDPYRNGGSVNMFGNQIAVGGAYSASAYDFNGEFASTYSYAFSCDISQEVYHPAYVIPGTPVQGYYVNCDFGHGQGNDNSGVCEDTTQPQGSCLAHNNTGPSFGQWGEDTEQCKFIKTADAVPEQPVEESWDEKAFVGNETATTPISQDQTETLLAHEDFGEGFSTSETLNIGKVVVCISPKKLPGTWTKQNGYTGDKCTTAWYNGGAMTGVSNLNTGSHNWVTVPVL